MSNDLQAGVACESVSRPSPGRALDMKCKGMLVDGDGNEPRVHTGGQH